jgi:Protein of unknown function (DUF3306)
MSISARRINAAFIGAVVCGLSAVAAALPAAAQDARQEIVALSEPAARERPAPWATDPGSLTWESDFTPFMASECPEQLRLTALRRLWNLLPPVVLEQNPAI